MEHPSKKPKRKRRKVISCLTCRKDKAKCNRSEPCDRCARRGIADSCTFADEEDISLNHSNSQSQNAEEDQSDNSGRPHQTSRQSLKGWKERAVPLDRFQMGEMESYIPTNVYPDTYTRETEDLRRLSHAHQPSVDLVTPSSTSNISQQNYSPALQSRSQPYQGDIVSYNSVYRNTSNGSVSTREESRYSDERNGRNDSTIFSVRSDERSSHSRLLQDSSQAHSSLSTPSMAPPPADVVADTPREEAANVMIRFTAVPHVPKILAMGFLEDYMRFFQPFIGLMDEEVLQKAMTSFCDLLTPESSTTNHNNRLNIGNNEFIHHIKYVSSHMHSITLQSSDIVRDDALLRVYSGLANEHHLRHQPSRRWLESAYCTKTSATFYTFARFLLYGMENGSPKIEHVRFLRLLASANHSQNSWAGLTLGNSALFLSLNLGMQHTLSLDDDLKVSTNKDIVERRRLYILCLVYDFNVFRLRKSLFSPPIVEIDFLLNFSKLDPYLTQLLWFDIIASELADLPDMDSTSWTGQDSASNKKIRGNLAAIESRLAQARQSLPQDSPLEIERSTSESQSSETIPLVARGFLCVSWTFLRLLAYRPYLNQLVRIKSFNNQTIHRDMLQAVHVSAETAYLLGNSILVLFERDNIFYKFAIGMLAHIQRCSCTLLLCLVACHQTKSIEIDLETKKRWLEIISQLNNLVQEFEKNGSEITVINTIARQLKRVEENSALLLQKQQQQAQPLTNNSVLSEDYIFQNDDYGGVSTTIPQSIIKPSQFTQQIMTQNWEIDAEALLELLSHYD